MRYLSVCSGIEAATVAWHPLGWTPVGFCEIEAFPSAVLGHHWPSVPNYGDFTRLIDAAHPVHASGVDLLVGGTPCQAFSVAGLRRGLADARGSLTLEFVRLAAALRPRWIVWENVPGVLSQDGGRAFGAFLGALVELGYGFAYRVLDAQYFGVAQRRRRVFVVACAGGRAERAAAVLFEPESVRRDSPPSREAGQRAAAVAGTSAQGGSGGLGAGHDGGRGGVGTDCYNGTITGDVAATIGTPGSSVNASGPKVLAHVVAPPQTYGGRGVAYSIQAGATRTNPNSGPDGMGVQIDHAYTIEARSEVQCVAHVVAPPQTEYPEVAEVCGTISDGAHNGGGLNGQDAYTGRVLPVAFTGDGVCVTGDRTHALKAEGADGSEDGTGRGTPIVTSIGFYPTEGRDFPAFNELSPTVKVGSGGTSGSPPGVMSVMAVRRLTPTECERLQGFPDGHTAVPYRGKPAADGPRYKALGNSMAVPVMRWLGERIAKVEQL